MTELLQSKFKHISDLENWVEVLEAETDKRALSSFKPPHSESPRGGYRKRNDIVLQTSKENMELKLSKAPLERSHRLGPKKDTTGNPRKRAIIVSFRSRAIDPG